MVKYSFVVPVYNESEIINDFYSAFLPYASALDGAFEVIFVTGGNTDNTFDILKAIALKDKRVKIINLSHRFNYQAALTAGLDHSSGEAVVSLDGDLQHPPEVIPGLIAQWKNGYDIVYTIRQETAGEGFFKKASSAIFYWLFKAFTRVDFEKNCADFRLLSRKALNAFKRYPEKKRFVPGIISSLGFKKVGIRYSTKAREKGVSKFNLSRLASLGIDGIFSFSVIPIRFITITGLIMTVLSFFYLIVVLISGFIHHSNPVGWSSVVTCVILLSGFQIFALGVIGEYVGRVYEEAKDRPIYLIDETVNL